MNNAFKNDKYWILGGLVIIALILMAYPYSPFNAFPMNVSRSEAIKIAEDYLDKLDIDYTGMYEEGMVYSNIVNNKFLLKNFGSEKLDSLEQNENLGNLGWTVFFHENKAVNEPQTSYKVVVSNNGSIIGYRRKIPDSTSIPTVSLDEAKDLITNTLQDELSVDLSEYTLTKNEQNEHNQRVDYFFRWEKSVEGIEGRIAVEGEVQGNQPSYYKVWFQVPDKYGNYVDAYEVIAGTISVIFVALLMMFAMYNFLKKYHQGEIWVNVGRTFFLMFFVTALLMAVNSWPNIGEDVTLGTLSFTITKVIIVLVNGLIIQLLMALLVFAAWSVGESYGREVWPEKLKGIDSFVKRHFFTVSAGVSTLRGVVLGLGLALVYLLASVIFDNPGSQLFVYPLSQFRVFYGFIPVVSSITNSFLGSSLTGIIVSFFVVNLVYSKKHNKSKAILWAGVAAVLVNIIITTPPSLNSLVVDILVCFLFGAALAYLYFVFDFLTILIMLFYAGVAYDAFVIYPSDAGFYQWNFVLMAASFLVAPAIYVVSRIRKQEFELKNYGLPSHVKRISERERLKKELEIAAKVQLSLLPKEQPKVEGYDIVGFSLPAKEAGGDYYDFVQLSDNKLGIAVGDVSGKGVGAAIYMTLTKGILQAHAEENVSPGVVLGKVNKLLYKTIEKNSFVSMFYAVLDTANHTLLYARAGHNPGIFCSFEEADSKKLMSKGMALGLEEGKIFNETLLEETVALQKGDVVVFYTDGFTEAMNESLEQFGEEKLIEIVEKNRNKSSNDLLNLILKDVRKFTKEHPQQDDMTIVVLKRK